MRCFNQQHGHALPLVPGRLLPSTRLSHRLPATPKPSHQLSTAAPSSRLEQNPDGMDDACRGIQTRRAAERLQRITDGQPAWQCILPGSREVDARRGLPGIHPSSVNNMLMMVGVPQESVAMNTACRTQQSGRKLGKCTSSAQQLASAVPACRENPATSLLRVHEQICLLSAPDNSIPFLQLLLAPSCPRCAQPCRRPAAPAGGGRTPPPACQPCQCQQG